VSRNEWEHEHV